jgi:hypothetical protein
MYLKNKNLEESTGQVGSLTPNDDNSSTGQSTIIVAGGEPKQKPEQPLPPTKEVKLKEQLDNTTQRLE